MRVTTNSFPESLIHNLQRLTSRMGTLQEQAATGQRITQPSDDPAAAMRVLTYQAERSRLAQYHRNAQRGQDIIGATIAEVRNLLKVSERANEIISLNSDVFGTTAMSTYAIEIDALLEQALVNANANFNDEPLFGGTSANTRPFTVVSRDADGRITEIDYVGATTTAEFQMAEGTRLSPYSSHANNLEVETFLNNLIALRDALSSGDAAAVRAQAAPLQASEDALIASLSGHAAKQQRLEIEITQNGKRFTDLAEQISRDADADLAQTVVQLTQSQNAYQAALMSAGNILNKSLLDYI